MWEVWHLHGTSTEEGLAYRFGVSVTRRLTSSTRCVDSEGSLEDVVVSLGTHPLSQLARLISSEA